MTKVFIHNHTEYTLRVLFDAVFAPLTQKGFSKVDIAESLILIMKMDVGEVFCKAGWPAVSRKS